MAGASPAMTNRRMLCFATDPCAASCAAATLSWARLHRQRDSQSTARQARSSTPRRKLPGNPACSLGAGYREMLALVVLSFRKLFLGQPPKLAPFVHEMATAVLWIPHARHFARLPSTKLPSLRLNETFADRPRAARASAQQPIRHLARVPIAGAAQG